MVCARFGCWVPTRFCIRIRIRRNLELSKIVEVLQTADWWSDRTGRFTRFFTLAYDQAAFAAVHEQNILESLMAAPEDLLPWEALSCLKDRPFHPLARAKDWNGDHGYGYATETMASLPLHWVAVPRDQIVSGPAAQSAGQPLAESLLDPGQRDRLTQAARASHADSENWLWMPVHPWQWAWLNRSIPLKLSECIYLSIGAWNSDSHCVVAFACRHRKPRHASEARTLRSYAGGNSRPAATLST